MSDKIINISNLFSSHSLVTRQAARDIFELISQMPENSIILDLAQIDFASRSFFDELNNYENTFRLSGKKVEIINMNDHIASLLQMVKEKVDTTRGVSYESIAKASIISL
jgi:anti-anti-sigma regulatory factor